MTRVTFLGHGIVVRKSALIMRGIVREQLIVAMEQHPLDEDDLLYSFGPHFGGEACDAFISRLKALGLVHVDDFFELQWDHPDWLTFTATETVDVAQ